MTKPFNSATLSIATVAATFGCSGPALIVLNAAASGGLDERQAISWLFGIYFFGGLIGLVLSWRYRQPICGAYSIPGAVMMGTMLRDFSLPQAAGAYLVTGVLLLALGLSGWVEKIMNRLPLPIVMGMVAGTLLRFGTGIVTSVTAAPAVAGSALLGYFLVSRFYRRFPPILGALALGLMVALVTKKLAPGAGRLELVAPQLVLPRLDLAAVASISLPLAVLILGGENAQAIGVLLTQGYRPPVSVMTWASGLGGIVASFFGAHAAHLAGVMTAICASPEAGPRDERYVAAMINALLFILFGIFASVAVAFIRILPKELVALLAGLAIIGVLINAFELAFGSGKFRTGAFFSLIIALSGVTLLGIGASFWALVGGAAVSLFLERSDFERLGQRSLQQANS